MKPFIAPPLTSASAAAWVCGPPSNLMLWLRKGFTHRPFWNLFGTHTANEPFGFVGIPSAPGNVPK